MPRGVLTGTLWGIYRPGVLGTYPSWVTRTPGGTGYWGYYIYCGQETLPRGDLKNIMPTVAICTGDGHVVHSCGDCQVEVPIGSRSIAHPFYVMDNEAFDFVLRTNFFVEHSQTLSLTLQAPYVL